MVDVDGAVSLPETLCWVPNPFAPSQDKQCLRCGRLEEVIGPNSCGIDARTFVECIAQCGANFCGESCRKAAALQHNRICVGPVTDDHPLYKLKVMALKAGEMQYAMIMLAMAVVLAGDEKTCLIDTFANSTERHNTDEDAYIAQATHALMTEIMGQATAPSFQDWSNLLHHVNQNCMSVYIRSNYAVECGRIVDDVLYSEQYDYLLKLTDTSSLIELMDEADQHFPPVEMFCLLKEAAMHSCIPSHGIKCDSMQDLRYSPIFAAFKSSNFNSLTCSRIDNDADLEDRTFALEEKGITCHCIRCKFERQPEALECTTEELESLMALARLQTRYDDAAEVVNGMLKLAPQNGAALLLQSRIAGWQGDFSKRELLLKEAAVIATTDHDAICAALREASAYYRRDPSIKQHPSCSENKWVAVADLEDCVFVGENILDADECRQMVQVAETFHEKRDDINWTSSRHYAVPTTDIAIYQIPELLSWFNIQLERIIFPAMEANFDIDSCSRLRIFDAFLVKYDASTGQKRLPLHNDQSEYSLTIAMNPRIEYEGGGTYFCETNESIKTEVGGIVSFNGDLLHAGTMITKGKRYIIVCFIHTEKILQ